MRKRLAPQLVAVSLLASLSLYFSISAFRTMQRRELTNNLCQTAGNFLETGDLRYAYEALQTGLKRSGFADACVEVVDNGRIYTTNCIDPIVRYEKNVCRAQANTGVRAELSFPVRAGVIYFLFTWLGVFICLSGSTVFLLGITQSLLHNLSAELKARLLTEKQDRTKPGRLGRLVDIILKRTGVEQEVRTLIKGFELQLRTFEARTREEEALRSKKEIEIEKSKEYISKVGQIRHDLRSPLSALLALQGDFSGHGEENALLSGVIRRIRLLIDNLAEEESPDRRNGLQLCIAEVVVAESVGPLRKKFTQAKDVTISVRYDASELSLVYASAECFRGIIENLLENSFDAVPRGGHVSISIRSSGGICSICVEDDGAGINADVANKLFAKGGTYGKVNGTGLGLFNARETLRRWNGEIGFEPLLRGTKFTIRLPVAQAGITFIGVEAVENVFLIDDDPSLENYLRRTNHHVLGSAKTLEEGRSLLRIPRDDGDVALIDYDLGGDALGTDLIEEQAERRSVVLCASRLDDPSLVRRAKHLGVRVMPKALCFLED